MRKSYCILIGLIISLGLMAQPRLRTPEFYLGVHGGVTASSINFSPRVDNMSPITKACVLGGNGGLVFRYAGHKYCHFQMELNYMHHGWSETSDSIGRYSRSLHYIELPILMHLNFGSEVCRWFLNFGPQIGYCIKDGGGKGPLVNGIGAVEYKTVDHPFYWGMLGGTGVLVHTPHAGVLDLEVRFCYSFGGVFGTNLVDHFNMASPMDLSLNIGWLWPIKGRSKAKIKNLKRYENKL